VGEYMWVVCAIVIQIYTGSLGPDPKSEGQVPRSCCARFHFALTPNLAHSIPLPHIVWCVN